MKNNSLYWVLGGGCVVNFAAHLWFYPSLPQVIPIHWGMDGTVNGWGPRYVSLILAALPLLMQCISQAQLCCDLLDTRKTDVLIQNILGEGMPRVMDAVAEGRRLDDGSL